MVGSINTLPTLQIGGQHKHVTHPTNWWAAKTRYPPYKLVGNINTLPTLQIGGQHKHVTHPTNWWAT
ncbi:MAG TPA: hypothetical protein ENF37_03275 [Beggiatoa sp.]|nr:hypothetical protein [Beggiatoa sp.]